MAIDSVAELAKKIIGLIKNAAAMPFRHGANGRMLVLRQD
jgi:hypothetical protein